MRIYRHAACAPDTVPATTSIRKSCPQSRLNVCDRIGDYVNNLQQLETIIVLLTVMVALTTVGAGLPFPTQFYW